MMTTEKKRAASRRRAFVSGVAQTFDAYPQITPPPVYDEAGRKKDAENLARDWQNIGGDIYKGMMLYKKHGY